MLHIMLACVRTHELVSTGIETDLELFHRVTGSIVSAAMSCVRPHSPLDQE